MNKKNLKLLGIIVVSVVSSVRIHAQEYPSSLHAGSTQENSSVVIICKPNFKDEPSWKIDPKTKEPTPNKILCTIVHHLLSKVSQEQVNESMLEFNSTLKEATKAGKLSNEIARFNNSRQHFCDGRKLKASEKKKYEWSSTVTKEVRKTEENQLDEYEKLCAWKSFEDQVESERKAVQAKLGDCSLNTTVFNLEFTRQGDIWVNQEEGDAFGCPFVKISSIYPDHYSDEARKASNLVLYSYSQTRSLKGKVTEKCKVWENRQDYRWMVPQKMSGINCSNIEWK